MMRRSWPQYSRRAGSRWCCESEDVMSDGRPRSNNTTLWIVLAIVGCVLFLCVALPVGLGMASMVLIKRTANQAFTQIGNEIGAQLVAESFLEDLRTGDIKGAYETTSEDYHEKYTLEEFQGFLEKHRALNDRSIQLEQG